MKHNLKIGVGLAALVAALGAGSMVLRKVAVVQASGTMAPRFEVNPMWPKPLPNHWVVGNVIGVSVDAQDHIWIIHRAGSLEPKEIYMTSHSADCCTPAPPVLEFDEEGNLLRSWGGPGEGYDWPLSNHGITVDYKGNVWIGGNGRGTRPGATARAEGTPAEDQTSQGAYYHDNQVLKFTQDGKFLMQIGKPGMSKGSNDTDNLRLPAKLFIDKKTDELYVADGYGNRRVIVFDASTGKFKRYWGAYGHKPDDTNLGNYDPSAPIAQQFRNPVHCADVSDDGYVYVCDRVNDRLQVFKTDGTFVKEAIYNKNTLGDGAVWDVAFSKDPQQKYLYIADGANEKIHIVERESLAVVASFGDGGRQPGQFYAVHSIATDSKGNVFTTETYRGQRVQKFEYKGLASVVKTDEGVLWPTKK
jgi:DNA-binding beta-propeller fold protein YncE